MFVVLVLSMLAAAASAEKAPHLPSYQNSGPTFEEVSDLLNVVELEKFGLFEDLSSITTLCAVVGENIARLTEEFNPVISNSNQQQAEMIQVFSDQIKSLHHGADAAGAKMAEVLSIARDTASIVTEQIENYLNGSEVADAQDRTQEEIDMLRATLNSTKQEILEDTADILASIVSLPNEISAVEKLTNDIAEKTCEHGVGTFKPGEHDVFFKTNFTVPPVVTLLMVGFTSHLDVHFYDSQGYHKVDTLGLDKYVDYVNERGFGVQLSDETEGSVALKTVSCSWAACQNLDVDIHNA